TAETVEGHHMHAEYYRVHQERAAAINRGKAEGVHCIVVGPTDVRTLGSDAADYGVVLTGSSWTEIFIYTGYRFKVIDAMVTNFHLPRSTLLMLVSAFAGREQVLRAYEEAIAMGYRFYSFGDAMLIL